MTSRIARALITAFLLVSGFAASAQQYPTRPVRLIVPFAPGGGNDIVGRILAEALTPALGQTVIVENRAGAGSVLGVDIAAKATPDGYTMLMANIALAFNAALYRRLPYDAVRDFQPLSQVANMYYVMAAHNSVPARNLKELVALAKAQPGKLNFSSSGLGAGNHLATELLKSMYGLKMVHVPYKGNVAGLLACTTGEVDFGTYAVAPAIPIIKSNKVRPLAALTESRLRLLPDVPTAREQGIDLVTVQWYGLLAPAATPRPIVERLVAEIHKAVQAPDLKSKLEASGIDAAMSTPEQLGELIRSEIKRYAKVVEAAGIRLD